MPIDKGDKQAVTIWIDKKTLEKIEKLAAKGDITRSKLITNIVEVGVEDLEVMNKLGVWATARVFEDMRQWFKKRHAAKKEKNEDKTEE
ncbi:MAG: ribbon-helix-helix protein, CopG family [Syntrophaceae bacterium]|nr:ribbon-helix-helix protein, CopG family [Syntrophaceae bacterium]